MASRFCSSLLVGLLLLAGPASAQTVTSGERDTVAWEFPHVPVASIPTNTFTTALRTRIRAEFDAIITLGNCLSPLQVFHGDNPTTEEYWVYNQPGRIVTTLAWMYPHLSAAQQTQAATYVTTELASATCQPWASSPLAPSAGSARRERFPVDRINYITYNSANYTAQPEIAALYGLWLWCWRTTSSGSSVTSCLTANQTSIRSMYTSRTAQGNIYGTMGAHVAKARLEQIWGNTTNRDAALATLLTVLNDGLTFSTMDTRTRAYWNNAYQCARRINGHPNGEMFQDMAPEIGRYIASEAITATTDHISTVKASYPLWWLRQAPYSGSWTGDQCNVESAGLSPEAMGMLAAVERWTTSASSAQWQTYARSGPLSYADLYWLELAVFALEAQGTQSWVDVRNAVP